jgi:hypothetical protein
MQTSRSHGKALKLRRKGAVREEIGRPDQRSSEKADREETAQSGCAMLNRTAKKIYMKRQYVSVRSQFVNLNQIDIHPVGTDMETNPVNPPIMQENFTNCSLGWS